jgi:predicted dinucleotide-binding enzyme
MAVLGAGHSGPVIARVAIDAGYRVSIADSGDPEQIELAILNHIGYHELDDERRPAGSPGRRALGVAGDDPRALDVVFR